MESTEIRVPVTEERAVRGTMHLPPAGSWPAPAVLFAHGFKGWKDWGGWPWLAARVAERGFLVVRFSFSLCGVEESADLHDAPEKFARNTLGQELEDLACLVEARPWTVPPEAVGPGLGLLGHSRGGLTALLFASENETVEAVVTFGSPSRALRLSDEQLALWGQQGRLEVPNARTGQMLHLERSVLEDFQANEARYDVIAALERRSVPTLLIHGEEDETVPVGQAEELRRGVRAESRLIRIPEAGHTFGAIHPFSHPTPALARVAEEASCWFEGRLGR